MPRCTFADVRGRCRRPGLGRPPLCTGHFRLLYDHVDPGAPDAADSVFDQLLNHPLAQQVVTHLGAIFSDLRLETPQAPYPEASPHYRGPDRGYAADTNRDPVPGAKPPPAPSPDPMLDARAALHFGPEETLTTEMVRRRRKQLAALCHPDRGGSNRALQRINAAADALLAQLR